MPLYETLCETCNDRAQIWRTIDERNNLPPCVRCMGNCRRVIVAPRISPDITPFISPNGKPINSREEWREDLKRSGAYAWEKGIEKDIARNREHEIEKAFAPLAAAVDSNVAAMVAAGKLET